jgi:hypothetical protein
MKLTFRGHAYEASTPIQLDEAVKVTETHGQVDELIEALRFSTAKTLTIALPDKQPPDVPERRGAKHLNQEGFKLRTDRCCNSKSTGFMNPFIL